jgi:ribokinase
MPTPAQISNEMKWEHIDWLVVNEGEAQQLLDVFPYSYPTSRKLPGNVPDSALHSSVLILRLASQPSFKKVNIVCTLGPLGVLVHLSSATKDGDTPFIYDFGVPAKVRDTTGAGDCWTGYLVGGLMELEATASTDLYEEDVRQLLKRCNQVR